LCETAAGSELGHETEWQPTIKSPDEMNAMRAAGRVLSEVLDIVCQRCEVGVCLAAIDHLALDEILARGARPSFLGYHPPFSSQAYPATLCLSVNEVILHGIPDGRVLRGGDIVSIDCGVLLDGMHADAARTVAVGDVDARAINLVETTRSALEAACRAALAGSAIDQISATIGTIARDHGCGIVPDFGGHGIGRALHESPHIANEATGQLGIVLREGMAIAIEPIFTEGEGGYQVAEDGWSVLTIDGSRAAHFEDTVLVTACGPEVVTRAKHRNREP
jgi:methionyl aminopeptidase